MTEKNAATQLEPNNIQLDAKPGSETALEKPTEKSKEKRRTVGNKIYDWGVYTTFAWGGVALASAISAHESQYGTNKAFNWLRSLNDNCIRGISNFLSSTIMKGAPAHKILGWAKGTTMFVTLGLGGWAMMAPIKWMEDNRQRNAGRIDNCLGTTPPDPETIEHEPKQTWHSVLSGRMFSWAVSYAAFVAMGPALTGKLNDKIGDIATKTWIKIRPSSHLPTVRKWADIAAFDALFTVITACVTYLWSRHVAREDEKEKQVVAAPLTTAINEIPVLIEAAMPIQDKEFTKIHKPMEKRVNIQKSLYAEKIAMDDKTPALA